MGIAAFRRIFARRKAGVEKDVVIMSIARARSWVAVADARAREAVLGSIAADTLVIVGVVKVISLLEAFLVGMGLLAYRWKMSGKEEGWARRDWS